MKLQVKYCILIIALVSSALAHAFEYESIKLEASLSPTTLPDSLAREYPAVVLKNDFVIEYAYQQNQMVVFHTVHKVIQVISDRGVEAFNKVYIPFARSFELVDIKVRAVSPGGVITNLDTSNIKEVSNLDDGGAYRIFAVEGAQKMGVVEMLYTLRNEVSAYGRHFMQDELPVLESSFKLVSPTNINFDTKGYNFAFEFTDTVVKNARLQAYKATRVRGVGKEKYAARDANLARVEYNFSYNTSISTRFINTWNEAAKKLHDVFYQPDTRVEKKIRNILKKLDIDHHDLAGKVATIEIYLKNTYQLKEYDGIDGIETIQRALENKYTNKEGFTRLFCMFLEVAGIEHQLGCTSSRFETWFDKDFPTWNYLYEYVIYLPGLDTYLSPTAVQFRLGIIPPGQLNNQALFLKRVTIDGHTSVLADVKTIPQSTSHYNYNNQAARVLIDAEQGLARVTYRQELGGYEANFIQPFYDFIQPGKSADYIKQILSLMGKDTKVIQYSVENLSHDTPAVHKPVVISGIVEVKSLVEKAGNNLVFNIGNVIGEQVEMYDEHDRQLPIDLDFGHQYHRSIEVTIPPGYAPRGLESLNIDKQYNNGAFGFISTYTVKDSTLQVDVREYYRDSFYPLQSYVHFRNVINAAADFNKIAIVLEKMQ